MSGRREPVEPRATHHIGVAVYSRDTVDNVAVSEDTYRLIDDAIALYNTSFPMRKRRDDFNFYEGTAPTDPAPNAKRAMELELPYDVDPHGPISQLARAATERYGFAMVASVDTSVSVASNQVTDLAIERLQQLNKSGLLGFIFVVEKAEDRDNESRVGRLERLQAGVGQLSLPHLTLVTRESTGTLPDLADVVAEAAGTQDFGHSDPPAEPGPER